MAIGHGVVLHVPEVGELMFGAGGGTGGLGPLHGEAAHHEAFGETTGGFEVARADAGGIGERVAERELDELPGGGVDGFDAEGVGEDPVCAGGDFGEKVGVAGSVHLRGGAADDFQISQDRDGGGAVEGLFDAVERDGSAEGGVAVHGGGGGDAHVRATQAVGGEFDEVVDDPGADGDGDGVVGGEPLLDLVDEGVFGVEVGVGEDEGGRVSVAGGSEGGLDLFAGDGEGVGVADEGGGLVWEGFGERGGDGREDVDADVEVFGFAGGGEGAF